MTTPHNWSLASLIQSKINISKFDMGYKADHAAFFVAEWRCVVLESNMASSLFDIEIDGVRQGVVEVTNPFPQTIELGLAPFEGLNDGKPHQIRLVEAVASE